MASFINTDMLSVGECIARCRGIRVPEYQRSYAWTEDEVLQLWQDVRDSMDNKRPEYFIGPVVVKGKDTLEVEVIDGQQRLTTIMIMLNALRLEFRKHGDAERADLIGSQYFVGKKDIKTLQTSYKFAMNDENGTCFREYLGKEVSIDVITKAAEDLPKGRSNRLLLGAMTSSYEQLLEYQGSAYNSARLIELYEYVTENIKILVLSVEDEADAYTIFETLNDRGRSLDTLDLLKNHLFARAKSYLPDVRSHWQSLRENLLEVDPKNRFLHHYWTSEHGRTSSNSLFRSMRADITDAASAVSFSSKAASAARVYEALQNPGSAFWDDFPVEVKRQISALVLLDAQQALPILMAANGRFSPEEFVKLTRLLVVMAIRYNFIGEQRTGVLANYYSEVARRISSGEHKKASHVASGLKPIYPSDLAFRDSFAIKSSGDARRVRFLLSEIESQMTGHAQVANPDPEKVNLEHILPKKINQHWVEEVTNIPSDEYAQYTNRIGNLVLVEKSKNKALGSKSFDEKRVELLDGSPFASTRLAAEADVWNLGAIVERQKTLAKLAVSTWSYPMS